MLVQQDAAHKQEALIRQGTVYQNSLTVSHSHVAGDCHLGRSGSEGNRDPYRNICLRRALYICQQPHTQP